MKKSFLFKGIVIFLITVIISFYIGYSEKGLVFAQGKKDTNPQLPKKGYIGIKLIFKRGEPVKGYYFLGLKPGESTEGKFEVTNYSGTPMHVRIYPGDAFNQKNGTLSGTLINEPVKQYGKWIKLEKESDIIPGGKKAKYSFKFSVPKNTKPGDYMAFIFVQPAPPKEKDDNTKEDPSKKKKKIAKFMLKIEKRLGIVIWERNPGEFIRAVEFSPIKKSFNKGKLFLNFSILNRGNLFIKPILSWKLSDSKGEIFLEKKPEMIGYLLPALENEIIIPIISSRPLPKGEYQLQITLKDEKSKYTQNKSYKIKLP